MLELTKVIEGLGSEPAMVGGQAVTVRLVPAVVMTALRQALPCPPTVYVERAGEMVPEGGDVEEAKRRADQIRINLLELGAALGLSLAVSVQYPAGYGGRDSLARVEKLTLTAEQAARDALQARAWVEACLAPTGLAGLPDAVLADARKALRRLEKRVMGIGGVEAEGGVGNGSSEGEA